MCFKDKFVTVPELDSEGFTDHAAKCRGCSPTDMCPRSGHCERYDSPLRDGVVVLSDHSAPDAYFGWRG